MEKIKHNEIDLVVLDLAGTTIEDAGQVPEAFISTLRENAIRITDDDVMNIRGASKKEALRILVKQQFGNDSDYREEFIERVYIDFQERLRKQYAYGGVNFIPGTLETITWLQKKEIKVALNTGFDRVITDTIFNSLNWQGVMVNSIVCGDDVSLGRPAPFLIFKAMENTSTIDIHKVMSVGDTILDLRTGYNSGIRYNIGVLSGAHSEELLRKENHTSILNSITDLPSLWESYIN